jgi:predicted DNA-binding transcriptional regulator AlpA
MSALPTDPERYLDSAQMAEFMGVSAKTIRKWTAEGCPHETWGMRAYRYLPSEVVDWARQRTKVEA